MLRKRRRPVTPALDDIDLWIGGLAEEKMPFGGMLGSTFNFVFENQLEKLQDGDRFYYLERTAGLAFNAELEGNSFAKLIMANTDVTASSWRSCFTTPAFTLEVDRSVPERSSSTASGRCDASRRPDPTRAMIAAHPAGDPRQSHTTVNLRRRFRRDQLQLSRYTGGDHVVLGGTARQRHSDRQCGRRHALGR